MHRLSVMLFTTLACFAFASGPGALSQTQSVPKDILRAGKADFLTYCATCHGRSGKGEGPVAKHLRGVPADLTKLTATNDGKFPRERVHMVIDGRKAVAGHGTREMPIWGNWFKFVARVGDPNRTDDETAEIIVALRIQGLIDYLNSIQTD